MHISTEKFICCGLYFKPNLIVKNYEFQEHHHYSSVKGSQYNNYIFVYSLENECTCELRIFENYICRYRYIYTYINIGNVTTMLLAKTTDYFLH